MKNLAFLLALILPVAASAGPGPRSVKLEVPPAADSASAAAVDVPAAAEGSGAVAAPAPAAGLAAAAASGAGAQAAVSPAKAGQTKAAAGADLDRQDVSAAYRDAGRPFDGTGAVAKDEDVAETARKPRAPRTPRKKPQQPDDGQTTQPGTMPRTPNATVQFGKAELPLIAMPHQGDDISQLWRNAHAQSTALLHASYNFDDMEMAKAIVAASRAGQKQIMVADYSNWFPERLSQEHHGGQFSPRTPAMQYVIDNLNPNLDLYILKGLGSIGINHNKFSLFTSADGQKLLQGGSFNYTGTSQKNHWENVVFTNDAERVEYFEKYFQWLMRRARKFSPDLEPQDPKMDPADPIPVPPASKDIVFHGVPFPKASFSPNGGTEGQIVKAEDHVQQSHDILMFSPFPTPEMAKAILTLREKKLPVRMIADAGQVENATPIVPLYEAGTEIKTIEGPDVVLNHLPWSRSSKQHQKVELFDGRMADGMVKMGDSLNISKNALMHNFENTQFWQGLYVAYMQAHFDWLWTLAKPISQELIDKLKAKSEAWKSQHPGIERPQIEEPGQPAPTAPPAVPSV